MQLQPPQVRQDNSRQQKMCIIRPRGRQLHESYIDRPNISSKIDKVCKESPDLQSQRPKRCLVHGIGGSGKSQICLKFFLDGRNQYAFTGLCLACV